MVGCDVCGGRTERFDAEDFALEHHGLHAVAQGLSGVRCLECGEVFFDAPSAETYAKAGDELVIAARPGTTSGQSGTP